MDLKEKNVMRNVVYIVQIVINIIIHVLNVINYFGVKNVKIIVPNIVSIKYVQKLMEVVYVKKILFKKKDVMNVYQIILEKIVMRIVMKDVI
jgi:hypothetical protein